MASMYRGRHPASIHVPWLALALSIIGASMLVNPHAYLSPTYRVAFDVMGPRYWGLLMVTSAILSLVYVSPFTTFLLCAVVLTYAGFLLAAVVTGDAASPTGWVFPLTIGLATAQSVARVGIRGGS